MMTRIEPIDSNNLDELLPLVRLYQVFYRAEQIDATANKAFFAQFGPSSDKGCQFGYRLDGKLVAFATVYFSYASSIISKIAVMNDLYTLEAYRRQGIASELIRHCADYAQAQGAARLQWLTASDNLSAQAVYKSLGAQQSSWELFSLPSAYLK